MTADPVTAAFSASLRRLRAEQGLSKKALADLARVSVDTVRHVENGEGGTNLAVAGYLAAALGTTLPQMITEGSRPGTLPAPGAGPGRAEPFKLTDHDGAVLVVLDCGQDLHGHIQVTSERGVTVSACVEPEKIAPLAAALTRACGLEAS